MRLLPPAEYLRQNPLSPADFPQALPRRRSRSAVSSFPFLVLAELHLRLRDTLPQQCQPLRPGNQFLPDLLAFPAEEKAPDQFSA